MSSNSDGREKRKYSYFAMTDIDQELTCTLLQCTGHENRDFCNGGHLSDSAPTLCCGDCRSGAQDFVSNTISWRIAQKLQVMVDRSWETMLDGRDNPEMRQTIEELVDKGIGGEHPRLRAVDKRQMSDTARTVLRAITRLYDKSKVPVQPRDIYRNAGVNKEEYDDALLELVHLGEVSVTPEGVAPLAKEVPVSSLSLTPNDRRAADHDDSRSFYEELKAVTLRNSSVNAKPF